MFYVNLRQPLIHRLLIRAMHHFYLGLGSRNSVRLSVRPSVRLSEEKKERKKEKTTGVK